MWKVEETGGKKFITLNLEKAEERIWATVFKGDGQQFSKEMGNSFQRRS